MNNGEQISLETAHVHVRVDGHVHDHVRVHVHVHDHVRVRVRD
jgi:hypothetical protein